MDKVLRDYLLKESTGAGSHPHAGRPGQKGGSAPGKGGDKLRTALRRKGVRDRVISTSGNLARRARALLPGAKRDKIMAAHKKLSDILFSKNRTTRIWGKKPKLMKGKDPTNPWSYSSGKKKKERHGPGRYE